LKAEYQQKLSALQQQQKAVRKKIGQLRKMRKGAVDKLIQPLHELAFSHIDCLECAHCCKTTGPLFTTRDIERISAHLRLKPARFINQYLRTDEDNDHVLVQLPCPFLDEQNYCGIYEVRPKACREYPHTDRKNQQGILSLTQKNSSICPAVAEIFENLIKSSTVA
jgi:Fe-S-cluster containining protein